MTLKGFWTTRLAAARPQAEQDVKTVLGYTGMLWNHGNVEPGQGPFGLYPVKLNAAELGAGLKAMRERRWTMLEYFMFWRKLRESVNTLPENQQWQAWKRLWALWRQDAKAPLTVNNPRFRPYDYQVPMGIRRMSGGGLVDFF